MAPKYVIGFFVALMLSGMGSVLYFGVQAKTIPKILLSKFDSPHVVANSLYLSLSQDLFESRVVFWGADPDDSYYRDILQQFLQMNSSLQLKFDAVVVDRSFGGLAIPPSMNVQQFSLKEEQERFLQGLVQMPKAADGLPLRLLVIVPTLEASQKLPGSLISIAKQRLLAQAPDVKVSARVREPLDIVFAHFPRSREEEDSYRLQIPCHTGEEDRGGIAPLGCLILQKSRAVYRKKFPVGEWVGMLEQVGGNDYLFLLTQQNEKSGSTNAPAVN